MDGCDALPDTKACRGECRDELERARLQPETGHENHRYHWFDEGFNGVKTGIFTHPKGLQEAAEAFQLILETSWPSSVAKPELGLLASL